ncbi:MAG: Ldh family oxidoreductase [Rhodospirillaceae bacterium]|nr:Ldh family oxidoreductase [Rhodospirillaceae bacterium]
MTTAAQAAYRADDLVRFARDLFTAAGCDGDKPAIIAELLVAADLLGHTTHGLQLCAPYLAELEAGRMTRSGEPAVIADRGATLTWDGRRLPGVWLTAKAVDLAVGRARERGLAAVAIRRSHHIACLAAFLERATVHGMMAVIASSDPNDASVAPFGGTRAVFTPDPIAVGIPTDADPILIDISASITTNGLSNRLRKEGRRYPGAWAMDALGRATDDPAVLAADPPGTLLPIGGKEYGHKGYGLALMIEALTQGLAGFGRADPAEGWGAGVFVLVLDPEAFAGAQAFRRQTAWSAAACRDNPPAPGVERVRLPGEQALARRQRAEAEGVRLYPGIMESLRPWAEKLGVRPPRPIQPPA